MNNLHLTEKHVTLLLNSWEKLLAFKSSISFAKKNILNVYKFNNNITPPAWQLPGTHIPSILTAGTYKGKHGTEFWSTRIHPEYNKLQRENIQGRNTLVIDLKEEPYQRIVIDLPPHEDLATWQKKLLQHSS